MDRYLDNIPEPWNKIDIHKALHNNFIDARNSIEETSGGKLWNLFNQLNDSLWIFESSINSLLEEICLFAERSNYPNFWHATNDSEIEEYTRSVKQKIFYCTSSIMALVDHARNFQNAYPVDNYIDKLRTEFSSTYIHDFMQGFRNYNSHWRIAETNWEGSTNFESKASEMRFIIKKSELLLWKGWNTKAKEFIKNSNKDINVNTLFSDYRKSVQKFYKWHRGSVLDKYSKVLQPYFTYKRIYYGLQKKTSWNLILSHIPKDLNPYEYLEQYLSKPQIEKLLTFEHRSKNQVEALINILDMEEFCDEDLKNKAIKLFENKKL